MQSWLVLRVAPQKEFEAARRIARRGHQAICPFELKWRRRDSRSRHKIAKPYPLFTRYVFAGISRWPHDYRDIFDNIEEVQGVIGAGMSPVVLSEPAMNWIRALAEAKGDLKQIGSAIAVHKAIKPGEPVRITEGAFNGIVGPLSNIVGQNAEVLVQIFNSMHLVKVPLAKLERA
jgi:transcription antitermination factor NusG